jgi:hypothetical protein
MKGNLRPEGAILKIENYLAIISMLPFRAMGLGGLYFIPRRHPFRALPWAGIYQTFSLKFFKSLFSNIKPL